MKLRTGYTTGSSATAAARAALLAVEGQEIQDSVEILLPKGKRLRIGIHACAFGRDRASCTVIKDGGDDPDVTHGAEIISEVSPAGAPGEVVIEGGEGVGVVTKPGVGLEIGSPAINPVPRRMIEENIREVGGAMLDKSGVRVVVSVPRGKELAPKTDNPRIGIKGGISILGTSGIVIPFSTASFAAAVRQAIGVAAAMGEKEVVLTTGSRSEDGARGTVPLPDHCYVQMGDFAGYAIKQCAEQGIGTVRVAGFIGKVAKMAAGASQTHVKGSKVDTAFLAGLAERAGAGADLAGRIRGANTARHVLEIVQEAGIDGFFGLVAAKAAGRMRAHSGGRVGVEVILFGFDGGVLARESEGIL
ncbi:MAG: cobalt-precorrin-5B (C(1))-methyltransferase [Nitrosopumilus sp.]|nr:cobalt-precorrin-5B (C(1))-methyltransferase [Nitrosopumilus sp.]MDA7942592.1 cobalt-precorrin-5B (C(1))-methyltransferase [Nitrosopumilus sp.]